MPKHTGIYIHIPFCRKKCNYCDFVSLPADSYTLKRQIVNYLLSLSDEMSVFLPGKSSGERLTLYIGGGTPSLLSEKQLEFLFGNILNREYIKNGTIDEFTVEVNPESLTDDKLKLFRQYGGNRLSIGCQSLDETILKFLGRVHTKTDFCRCYDLARKNGFENINIDLIFGVPGQTLNGWKNTLWEAAGLIPEHISVYSLTIEKGTKFYKENLKKDDDIDADMYRTAIRFLKKKGYHHYEISNFSKPGFESSHNINYWHNGEYYGFGLGAVSYLAGRRITNTGDMKKYLSGEYRESFEELSYEKKISENLMLGLRMLDGVKPGKDALKLHSETISYLEKNNLLKKSGAKLKLTGKGIMLANYVFRELL